MAAAVDALLVAKQALAEAIWDCGATDGVPTVEEAYDGYDEEIGVAAAEKAVVLLQARINCEVKALLSEEQIQELEERRAQRMERMQQHREQMQTTLDEWVDSYLDI